MITIDPQKPSVPVANPRRKNNIAPKIVEIAVIKTAAVPNPVFVVELFFIRKTSVIWEQR